MKFILPEFSDLTLEQKNLVVIDLDDPQRKWWGENLVVKGYGGTGKTVVACYRALRFQKQNKRILFLCFWKALKSFLATEKLGYENLHLQLFYHRMRWKLEKKLKIQGAVAYQGGVFRLESFLKKLWYGKEREYFRIIYEKDGVVISENINGQRYYLHNQEKDFLLLFFWWYKQEVLGGDFLYDEIYIDEAQDVPPKVLESLKVLAPHFSVFADENQRIGKFGEWSSILDIAKIFFPNVSVPEDQVEELTINMRSTKEICKHAAECFLPENEATKMIEQSKQCKSIPNSISSRNFFPSWEDQKEKIITWIQESQEKWFNIAIFCSGISTVDKIASFLKKQKIPYCKYHSKMNQGEGYNIIFDKDIFVSTYQSSKWLEADCVILLVEEKDYKKVIDNPDWGVYNNILYVLATRAKKKLYILFTFKDQIFDGSSSS